MDQFMEAASKVIGVGIGVLSMVALVFKWFQVRAQKRRYYGTQNSEEPIIGTEEDLRRAEHLEAAGGLIEEWRHELVLCERLSTFEGYSEDYAERVVATLFEEGIEARLRFQQSLPLGYASVLQPQGAFEIYVAEKDLSRAKMIFLEKFKND